MPADTSKYTALLNSLTWQGTHGQALNLFSKDGKGVKVITIAPDGHDGLHKGDLITSIDGHALNQVVDLVTYANAHMQDPAKLSVHRSGHEMDVALAAGS